MKRNQKAVAIGALLVIVCSCAAVFLLLGRAFSGKYVSSSASSQTSSGVTEESRGALNGEIMTPSAVTLSEAEDDMMPVYVHIPEVALPTATGCNAVIPQQGRESLTQEGMVELYEKMSEKVYNVAETPGEDQLYPVERITVKGSQLTDNQVVQVMTAFLHDHPEIFWISNRYGYSVSEDRTVVQLYAVAPASECEKLSKRIVSEAEKILLKLPENASALEKEIFLYKTVIQYCEYDEEGASNDQDWRAHSIVGAFLDGQAVCEGYSRAFQLLLNRAGVPSMLVTGTAGGAHMWNLVRIDGQWYHADATWDDNGDRPVYQYLNVTDEMIRTDHEIYPTADQAKDANGSQMYNLPLPSCTAVKANYYQAMGVHITSSDDTDTLAEAIERAAAKGEKSVYVYIDESLEYDEAISALFLEAPYQFMYAVRLANLSIDTLVNYNGCTYVEAEVSRGVEIRLSYEHGS